MKTCPSCGAATMARDITYTYKGESTTLPAVTGDFCTACDESVLDAVQSRRSMQMMQEFTKQVNASIFDRPSS